MREQKIETNMPRIREVQLMTTANIWRWLIKIAVSQGRIRPIRKGLQGIPSFSYWMLVKYLACFWKEMD
jgi:hypothetical protein